MDKRIPNSEIRRVWLDASLTSAEAARAVGLSRTGLWARAVKLHLPARVAGRREVIPRENLTPLWLANVKVADIARHFGCPDASVSQSARRYGLPRRPRGKRSLISLDAYLQSLLGAVMQRQAASEARIRRTALEAEEAWLKQGCA